MILVMNCGNLNKVLVENCAHFPHLLRDMGFDLLLYIIIIKELKNVADMVSESCVHFAAHQIPQ